jgi:hypothetical protein
MNECGGGILKGENWHTWRKTCSTFSAIDCMWMAWDRTLPCVVRWWQLTSWAVQYLVCVCKWNLLCLSTDCDKGLLDKISFPCAINATHYKETCCLFILVIRYVSEVKVYIYLLWVEWHVEGFGMAWQSCMAWQTCDNYDVFSVTSWEVWQFTFHLLGFSWLKRNVVVSVASYLSFVPFDYVTSRWKYIIIVVCDSICGQKQLCFVALFFEMMC